MVNRPQHRNPIEALGEEFLERRRRGEQATVQEYAVAHPELESDIRNLFPAMIAMEQFKNSRISSSGGKPVRVQFEGLEQLGDFRIIREIGRGGMGVVYEAEQQSLDRHVAVKVFPRQALSDSRQLRRFHREARTAARLHHTNIVPVFGVGEQDGMHYYVMQRIEGIALDAVIEDASRPESDRHGQPDETDRQASITDTGSGGLSALGGDCSHLEGSVSAILSGDAVAPKSIAELASNRTRQSRSEWSNVATVGIQVAEALAYAHAQGVLHRDIKPGNLILDAQGTVWITDFGLAMIIEAERESNPGDVVGTLRYMAPEHIQGEQDARSDIYSLGLTLYELLTLRPAFEGEDRAKLVHRILDGELSPPRELRPEIPRDLEAIVLQATACDPKRRYAKAEELAADLRRFLEGRPVRARRVGPAVRIWRWTRRNPIVALLSAALLLVVLTSFAIITLKWRDAVAESRRAEGNLSLALESMDQILERFGSTWMAHPTATETEEGEAVASGIDVQLAVSDYSAGVLQDTLKFYDRFAEQNGTNPQLQRETAKVHRRVADIYERLGQYGKAEEAYRRCLEILDAAQTEGDSDLAIEKASALNQLGLTMYATSRFAESEAEFRQARALLSEAPRRGDPHCQAELARSYNNLGQALWLMNRRDEARQSHQQAVAILENLVREYPRDIDYRLALARAYRIYYPFAMFGQRQGNPQKIRSAGIQILEELVGEFPGVPDYQCELSEMLATTSFRPRNSRGVGRPTASLQRAIELARELTEAHPSIPRYRAVLARALTSRAREVSAVRRDEANEIYAEAGELYRTLTGDFADIPAYHLFLAMALRDHAENLREVGRSADAREVLEEGISAQQAFLTLRPDSYFGNSMLARLYEELAKTLTVLDAIEEAEQASLEAQSLRRFSKSRS